MTTGQRNWRELVKRAQAGDSAARTTLMEANLRLVRSIVARFSSSGYEPEELFQVGCIGLLKAIMRFDLKQPVAFSTYAVPLILGEIRVFLRKDQPVRISRSLQDLAIRVEQVRNQFIQAHGQEPTINELAVTLDVPREELVLALEANQKPRSLFDDVGKQESEPLYLLEQISDPRQGDWHRLVDNLTLRDALGKLPTRQRQILLLRFVKEMTQAQIAQIMGVSQVQICRLEKKALSFLREHVGDPPVRKEVE